MERRIFNADSEQTGLTGGGENTFVKFEVTVFLINCSEPKPSPFMKFDPFVMKVLLGKRKAELQKIMKQMKHDELQSSPVYKTLKQELEILKKEAGVQEKRE
jgi:hypothetical protein